MPSPLPGWNSWDDIMREALHEAALAAQAGEIPVGAVIVDAQGAVVGRGRNTPIAASDPTAHAEIAAIRQAAKATGNYRLNGCLLAVTLEPCLMCAGAIIQARLKGLVYGAADPGAGAIASRLESLELAMHNHTVWHAGGVLEEACAAQLHDFFASRRAARRGGGT